MSKMIILKTDGTVEKREYPEGLKASLEALQSAVGGYVEFLDLPSNRATMVVNEEGKVYNLPKNLIATDFFVRNYKIDDYIVGNVVFIGNEIDQVGDAKGLSDEQADSLLFNIRWAIEEYEAEMFDRRLDLNEYLELKGE